MGFSINVWFKGFFVHMYVTNFPMHVSTHEIWNSCAKIGTLIDVFTVNKMKKIGKPFTFLWFIKVIDVDCIYSKHYFDWESTFFNECSSVWSQRKESYETNESCIIGSEHANIYDTRIVDVVSGSCCPWK